MIFVEAFENERRHPLKGFGPGNLFAHPHFSDATGYKDLKYTTLATALPPNGFAWQGDWELDTHYTQTDADGWSYALNYEYLVWNCQRSRSCAVPQITQHSRRRKWVRRAQALRVGTSRARSMTSSVGAVASGSRVDGRRDLKTTASRRQSQSLVADELHGFEIVKGLAGCARFDIFDSFASTSRISGVRNGRAQSVASGVSSVRLGGGGRVTQKSAEFCDALASILHWARRGGLDLKDVSPVVVRFPEYLNTPRDVRDQELSDQALSARHGKDGGIEREQAVVGAASSDEIEEKFSYSGDSQFASFKFMLPCTGATCTSVGITTKMPLGWKVSSICHNLLCLVSSVNAVVRCSEIVRTGCDFFVIVGVSL